MRVEGRLLLINLTRCLAQRRCCVLPFNCNCFVRPSIILVWKEEGLFLWAGSFVSFGGSE